MSSVRRRTVTVTLPNGLHLRPLTQIAQTAGRFQSKVQIVKDELVVDASSALSMMQLGAEHGEQLTIEADGSDAEEAVQEIVRLFEGGFEIEEPANNTQ